MSNVMSFRACLVGEICTVISMCKGITQMMHFLFDFVLIYCNFHIYRNCALPACGAQIQSKGSAGLEVTSVWVFVSCVCDLPRGNEGHFLLCFVDFICLFVHVQV